MSEITLPSPAKVNLFLELLKKRKDGYWQIETVLQEIDLHDEVHIRERKNGRITVTCSEGYIDGEKNIAYKAVKLMQDRFRLSGRGVEIHIEKRIPIGRGLGGGSSNAATVMKGLNQIWSLKATKEELAKLGVELGMDVPFFIYGGSCLGKGRGELITPLPPFSHFPILLVWPDFPIATAELYQRVPVSLTKKRKRATLLLKYLKNRDLEGVRNCLFNRLEEVALQMYPSLKEIKNKLGLLHGIMTGSGSAFFCFLNTPTENGEAIIRELKNFKGGYYVGETV